MAELKAAHKSGREKRIKTSVAYLELLRKYPYSEAAARAWYDDPDYQQLSEHRRASTDLKFLTMVHGLPPRS